MTSRAPVPAAEIGQPRRRRRHSSGQRRLGEPEPRQPAERPGPADSRRDRPKDAGPGRRRCRHGALPPARVRPTWSRRRRPRPPQVRGRGKGAEPLPPPAVPLRPAGVPRRARGGRSPVFAACAASAKFARPPGGGHGTPGPALRRGSPGRGRDSGRRPARRGSGPGSAVGTGVCPGWRASAAGTEPAAQHPAGAAPGPRTPGSRRAAAPRLAPVPLALECGAAVRTPAPPGLAGKLACPPGGPQGPLRLAWPSLRRTPLAPGLSVGLGAGWGGGAREQGPGTEPALGGPWLWFPAGGVTREQLGDVQAEDLVLRELVLWVLCKGNLFQVSGGPRRRRQSALLWARVTSSLGLARREPAELPPADTGARSAVARGLTPEDLGACHSCEGHKPTGGRGACLTMPGTWPASVQRLRLLDVPEDRRSGALLGLWHPQGVCPPGAGQPTPLLIPVPDSDELRFRSLSCTACPLGVASAEVSGKWPPAPAAGVCCLPKLVAVPSTAQPGPPRHKHLPPFSGPEINRISVAGGTVTANQNVHREGRKGKGKGFGLF